MSELLTTAQMRTIEQEAIASGDVTALELMERAGRGVVEAVFAEWPGLAAAPQRAVVLCGPGNNGGDGFVVARLLREWGWEVEVLLYGDPDKLPPDARANHDRWRSMGLIDTLGFPALTRRDLDRLDDAIQGEIRTPLVVDALFGTGLSRPASGLTGLFRMRERSPADLGVQKWVAVDVPSGLCADSGRDLADPGCQGPWCVLPADLTVTFHRPKLGHYLADGPAHCERLRVVDIGLDPRPLHGETLNLEIVTPALDAMTRAARLATSWQSSLDKRGGAHKFSHGHALVLSGGPGATGAARLAARGALRIGAGLVTLGVPPSAQMEVASQITAVMLARIGDAEALAEVLGDERINALCFGPGMGVERATAALRVILDPGVAAPRPTVIDADALTALARDTALMGRLHEDCILTPHAGEFARLFPDIAARLAEMPTHGPAYSKADAARDAAERAGCFVLYKGPDTVIAGPDGRYVINSAQYDRTAPWLATAGAGDVLAGFIAGLLARGLTPMMAAEAAAWLHVECARSFGPGLIAEDIPEELPKVFRALGVQAASERT